MRAAALFLLALALFVQGCAQPASKPGFRLDKATYSDLQGWPADDHAGALGAFVRSCENLVKRPDGRALDKGALGLTVGQWKPACRDALRLRDKPGQARAFFEGLFTPWAVMDGDEKLGLFTGYYEPTLRGSSKNKGPYRTPLYRRPDHYVTVELGAFGDEWKGRTLVGRLDGKRVLPTEQRTEIDAGALAGKGLELLWVDDPVDAFFLQIQGSGRVVLDDGGVVRVGYDGKNGHPYYAIGRKLIEDGEIPKEKMSMQAIRAWLARNPSRADAVMGLNKSYVFFRFNQAEGPIGAEGVPLSPGRSLAVDRRRLPLGAPVWLEANDPILPGEPLNRLLIAQDTGGAIKGAIRGDVFWGAGVDAEERAGRMKSKGRYFILLPKGVEPKI